MRTRKYRRQPRAANIFAFVLRFQTKATAAQRRLIDAPKRAPQRCHPSFQTRTPLAHNSTATSRVPIFFWGFYSHSYAFRSVFGIILTVMLVVFRYLW